MNSDLEGAGTLVSAGLVARELEAASLPHRHGEHGLGRCTDCGAPVAGAYCSQCGQSAHVHRSLLHLGEELLHGVFHFDTKGIRTVPLLVARPGVLTRRYIDGQRTRYVSPLALFLFSVFLMYFVFSLVGGAASSVHIGSNDAAATQQALDKAVTEANEKVEKASKAVAEASKTGTGLAAAQDAFGDARMQQRIADYAAKASNAALLRQRAPSREADAEPGEAESWKDIVAAAAKAQPDVSGWRGRLRQDLMNPELTIYKLKTSAYKYSFMLIPISLPFLWLLFAFRRDVAMYDHAVFSLYSLSFMSLLFTLLALMAAMGFEAPIAFAVLSIPPIHMFLQLRGTYQLGIFSALWRTAALLFVCGTAFVLFLLFVVVISLH